MIDLAHRSLVRPRPRRTGDDALTTATSHRGSLASASSLHYGLDELVTITDAPMAFRDHLAGI
jgi:hypothetical protein